MNGLQKRKSILNGFSKYGINECCCGCDPRQGRILATNIGTSDGTLDLTPYKNEGGEFQKWAIRYFYWHGNILLRGDIVSGELTNLPDTFNFGTYVNIDYHKKIYFELLVGCNNQGQITCVPPLFNTNFRETYDISFNTLVNKDFSLCIGFYGYHINWGNFDIGCDASVVWHNDISDPFYNAPKDRAGYCYLEHFRTNCGYD